MSQNFPSPPPTLKHPKARQLGVQKVKVPEFPTTLGIPKNSQSTQDFEKVGAARGDSVHFGGEFGMILAHLPSTKAFPPLFFILCPKIMGGYSNF